MTSIYGAFEGQDARHLIVSARELSRVQKIGMHIALDDVRMAVLEGTIKFFAP